MQGNLQKQYKHPNNEEWQIQQTRKLKKQNKPEKISKTLGTSNETSNGFRGVEKRLWIYIYRVRRDVETQIINDYIKKKQGYETANIQVKELPTEPTKNKCFLVVAPFEKKDELYSPSFWPKDVGIKRYDFKKQMNYNQTQTAFL